MSLLTRLKERKLVQWALAYLAAAWVLLEATGFVSEQFAWPAVVVRGLTVLAGVGFFVTLVLAWYHGEKGRQRVSGMELLLLAAVLFSGGIMLRSVQTVGHDQLPSDVEVLRPLESALDDDRPSLAALPFANRSGLEEDRYFTDGLHDEIISRLSTVSAMRVIARTSVEEYRETPKSVRVIGEELGVRYLLEGGVQRAGDRVRINVQLIDASNEGHLWAGLFDEELTTEFLFDIQSAITDSVATYLRVVIEAAEAARIAQRSTDNSEAYALFLKSRTAGRGLGVTEGFRAMRPLIEEAVGLDPGFAVAWARVAHIHSRLAQLGSEDTDHAALARKAVDQALELAPDLAESHLAHAELLYRVERDYEGALRALDQAEAGRMRDLDGMRSYVVRRAGRWDEALQYGLKALRTYPRAPDVHWDVARTLHLMRRYDEALPLFDRALDLRPNRITYRRDRAFAIWARDGVIGQASDLTVRFRHRVPYVARDWPTLLAELDEWPWGSVSLYDRWAAPRDFYRGVALRGLDDEAAAAAAFQNAVDTMEARVAGDRDSFRLVQALGLAYAGAGRAVDALEAGHRGLELMPPEKDALFGPWAYVRLAQIHSLLGQADSAVAYLEKTFAIPGDLSAWDVKMDPIYDSIRDHPGYDGLMERFGLEP